MSSEIFHVIEPRAFNRELLDELCELTDTARALAKSRAGADALRGLLADKRVMLYFTQASTRTFLSFNNACHLLGMRTSEIRDPAISSEIKGESFDDSIRTFSSYVDVIIMRTPERGLAGRAAALMDRIPRRVPIINAGSGPDQHPTQALLDIYTLERSFAGRGGIDGKTIGMMGDLRRGRTVRSLCHLMKSYHDVKLVFISPPSFAIRNDIKKQLAQSQISFSETGTLDDVIGSLDALYVTRMQSEWDVEGESLKVNLGEYSVGPDEMNLLPQDAVVMHPLPRGPEIDPAVDEDSRAVYWRQERNGMWMRVALLVRIFGAATALTEAAARVVSD
ncbi:MAG: aspartate carbamoyltransferase [Gammaproteobacteria bacterium]|nr:aspartate carbamoyltransferase [Gammaproteobacteria bacterium]NNF62276.1 aspartate carbamoyltransferase [Gammaproteobacteria bacterium]NNM20869.1 aspartate carbamoyltransferase [Gammaproteobacteria bacterium]